MTDDLKRIPLPRDGWADIRPRLKMAGRNLIQRHMVDIAGVAERMDTMQKDDADKLGIVATFTRDEMAAMQRFTGVSIVAWVADWSYDLPVTLESMDELDEDEYDTLNAVCGPLGLAAATGAQFGPDGASDPGSPTRPSDGTDSDRKDSSSTSDPETDGLPSA